MAQIPNGQPCSQNLSQNRGYCRSHHTPSQAKNKDGIQHNIHQRSRQSGGHGKLGAAVRADNGIHGLTKHIKRNAQSNIKEVLAGITKGLLIDPAAEHAENGILKNQINRRQHNADYDTKYNGVSDAFPGIFPLIGPQADAHIGTAAISNQNGQGKGNHRQRKHHRIGRVAVRAQVGRIGYKNLVHNVIKRCHQQGNNTGDGVLAHQASDGLCLQIRI